jgi:hypothetical protein
MERTEGEDREDRRPEERSGPAARGSGSPEAVRAADLEPYVGLLYVARLFKMAALVVVFALAGEVIAGVALEGAGALFPHFREIIQGIVLAAILWGAADLVLLLIDVGHDVRASRILLARITYRAVRREAPVLPGPGRARPVRPRDRTP